MSEFLKRFADNLNKNVPGFIGVAIAEVKTGIAIFSHSVDDEFDPELASTFYLEIVRAKINSIYVLKLKNQKIDTIVVNLTSQIHLVDLSDNGEYFIYLAIEDDKNDSLPVVKKLIEQYKQEIKSIQDELRMVHEDLQNYEMQKAKSYRDELEQIEKELKLIREDFNKTEDNKARLLREEREQIEIELKIVQEDLRKQSESEL